ncbi:Fur family transcriptional regulator [Lactobacillus sp. YT155]|uniref:Fur family transcriptional regulator n=1 Tax=Lactobacillus sp. YT155 TaxID=3060955 RepID=UPI00265D83B3|nr:Fur family transcriptional regulator [Lactobacillus sp. YT155]MDO1605417.1 Fur family transcriptional regulator [Lactobacillus sp. YT155]
MENKDLTLVVNTLKEHGYKLTSPRKQIVEYMISTHSHPTAEMIHREVKNLPVSTIYNTLEILIKLHLVIEIDNKNDDKTHYDYFGTPHYHVVCTNCGKIVDAEQFDFSKLPESAEKETGYQVTGVSIEVFGLCPDCQKLKDK